MKTVNAEKFHRLYGVEKKRINYQDKDFADYALMIAVCAALIGFAYGPLHPMTLVGLPLCAFMLVTFPARHGVKWKVPIVLRRPQELVYSLVHKVQNIKPQYFIALALLVAENALIAVTPNLPHHVAWMHTMAVGLFWAHFIFIACFRTAILAAHLMKKEHVRNVLMESVWKSNVERESRVVPELFHAYCTGMLTHIVYLIPWYLVIRYANFSLVFMPATCVIAFVLQKYSVKNLNDWFYRDHWLGHNSEFDFVYLHGTHHDALPCALIGVAGNGYLEGFFRSALAFPIPFFNPLAAAFFYTGDVKVDMELHQYIPGVYPKLSREFLSVIQHSLHHYGRLEPYGFAINLDQPISAELKKRTSVLPDELKYSIRLDEQLNGYEWDSARFRWFLDLVNKYHDTPDVPPREQAGELDARARG